MSNRSGRRPDFSNGLFHLTRSRKEYERASGLDAPKLKRTISAFEVLKEILRAGSIKGSGNEGYVKGDRSAVCFSEAPLAAVPGLVDPDGDGSRYTHYGLALSKKSVFEAGGRPVIYLPDLEGDWIPSEERWRHVRFEYGSVDFTHEREWRAPGDFDLTSARGLYVLVWSAPEAQEIYDLSCPVKSLIRGVLPMQHLSDFL